jgi:hypothetical protein
MVVFPVPPLPLATDTIKLSLPAESLPCHLLPALGAVHFNAGLTLSMRDSSTATGTNAFTSRAEAALAASDASPTLTAAALSPALSATRAAPT